MTEKHGTLHKYRHVSQLVPNLQYQYRRRFLHSRPGVQDVRRTRWGFVREAQTAPHKNNLHVRSTQGIGASFPGQFCY